MFELIFDYKMNNNLNTLKNASLLTEVSVILNNNSAYQIFKNCTYPIGFLIMDSKNFLSTIKINNVGVFQNNFPPVNIIIFIHLIMITLV